MSQVAASPVSDITSLSATEIAGKIASGDLSAREAVEAHIRRIEDVDKKLNAVVVPLFERAMREAEEADARRSRGEPLGPLHGVPITVKECYDVAGTATTGGLLRLGGQKAEADAPMVARMRQAGAVILGKTNLPHVMLFNEGDNPLYGRTNNPWNLDRSPGGGSSGEGSILAAYGSPLGLASDYGGSVRIPPDFCGIHGFKPTSGRLTIKGMFDDRLFAGMETVIDQPGPMARHVADLVLALRVLGAPGLEAVDRRVQPRPWGDPANVSIRGLRVAFYTDDGAFSPAPVKRRAVREAAAALEDRGAIADEFIPADMGRGRNIFLGLVSAAGAGWARRLTGKDKIDPRAGHPMLLMQIPNRILPAVAVALRLAGQPNTATYVGWGGRRSAASYWDLILERDRWIDGFFTAMDRGRYDVILCPSNPFPAYKHGTGYFLTSAGTYTQPYNLLGVPAGHVAATRVRRGEESDRRPSLDMVERTARVVEEGSAGMPAGVQVVSRPWREDVALAVMAALEEHFRGQPDYPSRPPI
jgi:fatty acid amide hydrolase